MPRISRTGAGANAVGSSLPPAVGPSRRLLPWWAGALVIYWLAMFIGTHIPLSVPTVGGRPVDKYLHFIAYFGLTVLLIGVFRCLRVRLRWKHFFIALALLVVYAALDEWLQKFVNRSCDTEDFMADSAGVLSALGLYIITHRDSAEPSAAQ
jgi:VanZ family protein